MRLSELVRQCQELQARHGDLEVLVDDYLHGSCDPRLEIGAYFADPEFGRTQEFVEMRADGRNPRQLRIANKHPDHVIL